MKHDKPSLSFAVPNQHPRLAHRVVAALGRPVTLDDIPDSELDRLARMGFDWLWFLSVWQTGPAGQRVSRGNAGWRKEFQETLSDLCEEDIAGSGFAITGYTVHTHSAATPPWPGCANGSRRGLRLLLDFVPNHIGLDHPWVRRIPIFISRARNGIWLGRRRTTPGSSASQAAGFSPTAATPISPAGLNAATQLRQPGPTGSHDRRTAEDRRTVRRRALRHGHAGAAGRF